MIDLKKIISQNDEALPFATPWRALQIFSIYRLIVSLSLLVIFLVQIDSASLGGYNPNLFYACSMLFVLFCFTSLILCVFIKQRFYLQIAIQVLVDITSVVLLMHASGGASSGLGVLLAVSTSAASILTAIPASLSFSVLASVAVFAEEWFTHYTYPVLKSSITAHAGILSVTFMATSLLAYYFSKRISASEHVAQESIIDLENMQKLNEDIIQFMSTGVLVVNHANQIKLINRSAWIHLGMPESTKSRKLEQVSTPLARQLKLWRNNTSYRSKTFRNTATGASLLPNFSAIANDKNNVIIFIEDNTFLNQQAQSLKLASLGRLTASIAHEIRNPLGALSHAAQLLKESNEMSDENRDMVEIIDKNTLRVNNIIENIMRLSQKKNVQVKAILLFQFIPQMLKEYLDGKEKKPIIDIQFQNKDLVVHFDMSQLSQILTNLIDNGIRYSEMNTGNPRVQLMIGVEPHSRTAFLDVIDDGEGIQPEVSEKIFEPFFTTSRSGTGLGLYISKELCESNRARLDYIPIPTKGSCFRISFSAANLTQK